LEQQSIRVLSLDSLLNRLKFKSVVSLARGQAATLANTGAGEKLLTTAQEGQESSSRLSRLRKTKGRGAVDDH
jgi:hypothetical protein